MLLRRARRGDARARDRLVRRYLPLTRAVAVRYSGLGLPLEDLVQEGALGLLEAIDLYDEARGRTFASYARFRVERAVRNALTEKGRLIRLPKGVVERRRAIERARREFVASHLGTGPTLDELEALTGLAVAAIREAEAATGQPLSLGDVVSSDGLPFPLAASDAAPPDPELEAIRREEREGLREALRELPSRQRTVVLQRYGVDGRPARTSEVAHDLGLSTRRTQTLESDAFFRLRSALAERGWSPAVARR